MPTLPDLLDYPDLDFERRVDLIQDGLIRFVERIDSEQRRKILEAGTAFFAGSTERASRIVPWLDKLSDDIIALGAAPLKTGYERRLTSMGYAPIRAKFAARYIVKFGAQFAKDYNEARGLLGSLIPQLARCPSGASLAIARRSKKLRKLLDLAEVQRLIKPVIETHLSLTVDQFAAIIELAAQRDQIACRRLVAIARVLAVELPCSRGPRLSIKTATHLFYLLELEDLGRPAGYSWHADRKEFTDPASKATQEELEDPDFDPRYAVRLFRENRRTNEALENARHRRQE
jgi:hypothetical protein